MLDFGIEGLYQTLESLNNYNIRFFGLAITKAGHSFYQKDSCRKPNFKVVVFSAFEHREGYDKDFSFYASSSKLV